MRRRNHLLSFPFLTLLPALGCGDEPAPPAATVPRRVVALGPSTVENLFALGLGGCVVAVDDYTVLPEAADRPRVGGQFNPSFEAITALGADLILTQGEFPELRRLGLPVVSFKTDSWARWEEEITALGARFGAAEAARALIEAKRGELASIARAESPAACLLVVGRKPGEAAGLVVAGAASFLNELLAAAGGRNVFAGNPRNYFDLSEEALIRAAPAVIFEFRPGEPEGAAAETRAAWQRSFSSLPAVRDGRIHVLTADFVLIPGPRMPEIAQLLAARLAYP